MKYTTKTKTVPAAMQTYVPDEQLLDDVTGLLAITFKQMYEDTLISYISDSFELDKDKARSVFRILVRRHIVSDDYSHYSFSTCYTMANEQRLNRLVALRKDMSPEKRKIFLEKSSKQPIGRVSSYEYNPYEFYRELAKAFLYPGTVMELSSRPGQYDSMRVFDQIRDILYTISNDDNLFSELGYIFDSIPYFLYTYVIDCTTSDCIAGKWKMDYDRMRSVIDHSPSLVPSDKSVLCQVISLPTRLLRGRFDDLGFTAEDASTRSGFATLSVGAYLEGDYKSAEKFMRSALKCSNTSGSFNISFFDLLYIASLRKSDSKMAQKTLDNLYRKVDFKREYKRLSLWMLLSSYYEENDSTYLSRIEDNIKYMDTLDAYVAYSILSKMNLDSSSAVKDVGKKLSKDKNYAILTNAALVPYTFRQKWEIAYDRLLEKLGYKEDTPQKTKKAAAAAATSKVCYYISDSGRYIQPVLKKSKDGISWTKGRNIALSTFFAGIPEMSDLDRQIASTVWNAANYGTPELRLGGAEPLKFLVGHNDVYLDDSIGTKVTIISEEPYISTKEKGGDIIFSSNVDLKYLPGYVQSLAQTDTLLKIISCTKRQKDILTSLVGISFPKNASDDVKKIISFISHDIVVHSDLMQETSAMKKVDCDSRTTVTMHPIGEGLKIDLYVKPFESVPPYYRPGDGGKSVISNIDGVAVQTERNLKEEKKNAASVVDMILEFFNENEPDKEAPFTFTCQDAEACLGIVEALQKMGDDVRVEWPEGCKFNIKSSCDFKNVSINVKGAGNWFEVSGSLNVAEDMVFQMGELLQMLRSSNGRFIKIGEGEFIALSTKLRAHLEAIAASAQNLGKKKFNIPSIAIGAVSEFEDEGAAVKEDSASKKLLKSIKESSDKSYPIPAGLKAELRPYQEEGYQWLCRLSSWGAGACLADDMGLGKTVQTIALLLHRAEEGSALVVAPASVVSNWEKELIRFSPALQVLSINQMDTESRRKAIESASQYDVVLTTYGLLLSERESFSARTWSTVVLDEAHVIKNKETKTSAACMEVSASFRIILTGTPIQNHLGEIWNLFQFINPGYLGSYQHFCETFLTPIQEYQDKDRQALLKKMILPFLLRRTKTEVLDELPRKTEQMVQVTLSDQEKAIYETLRREAQANMEEHRSNLVQTLSEITRLRLASCSVSLAQKGLDNIGSSKVDELVTMVDNIISGGHKILIFSQFTSFLAIIMKRFDTTGFKYLYLDGSTPISKRQGIVNDFQRGDTPIFLISLKAGGLGLNLTAADYIIHTDPWWNPSVEDQASDRAYRIGQSRPVTVYRLISKGTIEEKILTLHKDKRSLADSLLEGADVSSKLSREELMLLLAES